MRAPDVAGGGAPGPAVKDGCGSHAVFKLLGKWTLVSQDALRILLSEEVPWGGSERKKRHQPLPKGLLLSQKTTHTPHTYTLTAHTLHTPHRMHTTHGPSTHIHCAPHTHMHIPHTANTWAHVLITHRTHQMYVTQHKHVHTLYAPHTLYIHHAHKHPPHIYLAHTDHRCLPAACYMHVHIPQCHTCHVYTITHAKHMCVHAYHTETTHTYCSHAHTLHAPHMYTHTTHFAHIPHAHTHHTAHTCTHTPLT